MAPGATRETFMKKQMKKLVLAKETVRNLEETELAPIAGGTPSVDVICKSQGTSCPRGC
jgi:natural product precursor